MNAQLDTLDLQTGALRDSLSDLDRLAQSFGTRMVTAFASAAMQGRKLSDVLRGLALSLARMALTPALKPLGNLLGGMLSRWFPAGG